MRYIIAASTAYIIACLLLIAIMLFILLEQTPCVVYHPVVMPKIASRL